MRFLCVLPLQFSVVGTHSAIMGTAKAASKEELAIVRALFSSTKILPLATIIERETRVRAFFSSLTNHNRNLELEGRNGADRERHPGGAFLSEIDVFKGYKNKGLLLQTVSLFVPFKRTPLINLFGNLNYFEHFQYDLKIIFMSNVLFLIK